MRKESETYHSAFVTQECEQAEGNHPLSRKAEKRKGDVYIGGRGLFPSDESKAWSLVGLPLLPTSPLSVLSLGLFACYDLLDPRGS